MTSHNQQLFETIWPYFHCICTETDICKDVCQNSDITFGFSDL